MQLTSKKLKQLIKEQLLKEASREDLEFLRDLRYGSSTSITFADFLKIEAIYKAAQQSNDAITMQYIDETPALSDLVGSERKSRFEAGLRILENLLDIKYPTSEGEYSLGVAAQIDFDRWDEESEGEPFERDSDDLFLQVAKQIKDDAHFKQAAELLIGLRIINRDIKNPSSDSKRSFNYLTGPIISVGLASEDSAGYRPRFAIKTKKIDAEVNGQRERLAYAKTYFVGHQEDLDFGENKSYKIFKSQAL